MGNWIITDVNQKKFKNICDKCCFHCEYQNECTEECSKDIGKNCDECGNDFPFRKLDIRKQQL